MGASCCNHFYCCTQNYNNNDDDYDDDCCCCYCYYDYRTHNYNYDDEFHYHFHQALVFFKVAHFSVGDQRAGPRGSPLIATTAASGVPGVAVIDGCAPC